MIGPANKDDPPTVAIARWEEHSQDDGARGTCGRDECAPGDDGADPQPIYVPGDRFVRMSRGCLEASSVPDRRSPLQGWRRSRPTVSLGSRPPGSGPGAPISTHSAPPSD